MKNSWIRKNPWMSLWLSGANTVMNKARVQATAETRRRSVAAMTDSARRMTDWASILMPPTAKAAKKTTKRRRSR